MAREVIAYRPQPGFQTEALFCYADRLLTGGVAGPGKTWFLGYNALYDYRDNPNGEDLYKIPGYTAILFRRDQKHTEQMKRDFAPLYEGLGAEWSGPPYNRFKFPSGACVYIAHMHNVDDWSNYRGWEIHYAGFDEVPEFEEVQVSSILPWLRSTRMKVRPRLAATCNWEGLGVEWVKRWWNVQCPCKTEKDESGKVVYKGHDGANSLFYRNEDFKIVDKDTPGIKNSWCFIPGDFKTSFYAEVERKKGEIGKYAATIAQDCGGRDSPRYNALVRGCCEVAKSAFFSKFCEMHIIPDDMPLPENWNWQWSGGHDFASSPQGDAAGYVLARTNQNRDIVVEDEWYGWGLEVESQAKAFEPLHSKAAFAHSGDDIFAVNQGQAGDLRSIAGQFQAVGVQFLRADIDLKAMASMVRSALQATIQGQGGCLLIRARCKRLIDDFRFLLTDPKKLDEWDKEQRVRVDHNGVMHKYHFDVFRAFTHLYAGMYSADKPKDLDRPMNPKRREQLERNAERAEFDHVPDCSYAM